MGLPLAYGAGGQRDDLMEILKQRLLIQAQEEQRQRDAWQQQYQGRMAGVAEGGLSQRVREYDEGAPQRTAELESTQAGTEATRQTTAQKGTVFKRTEDARAQLGTDPVRQKILPLVDLGIAKDVDPFDPTGSQGQQWALDQIAERGRWGTRVANIAANARIVTDHPPAEKPSSGYERDTLRFYQRGREAIEEMEALEPELQKMSGAGQAYQLFAPNIMKSELGQRYLAAMKRYTEARLRKDSGAAVPPQEYVNDQKMASFVWGDRPETIAKKQASRRQIIDGLGFAAGRAYGEYYGSPFRPGQELAGTTDKVRMRAPTGEEFDADPEKVEFYEAKGATRVQQP